MFKGKVYFYKNINGKEDTFEQEFDNPRSYYDFIEANPEYNLTLDRGFINPFKQWHNLMENMIDKKFDQLLLGYDNLEKNKTQSNLPAWVNLDKYRKDLLKIREEKKIKEKEKNELNLAKKELESYLKEFEHDDKKTKDIKEDIKKIDARLKELI